MITELTIPEFMYKVRPGSGDWTWEQEVEDLLRDELHASRISELEEKIELEGQWDPVLVGSDGRLWDGHHRAAVFLCRYFGIDRYEPDPDVTIKVEFV